jgi:hypothetical protein
LLWISWGRWMLLVVALGKLLDMHTFTAYSKYFVYCEDSRDAEHIVELTLIFF